jgi:glycosyltransferase involved in cell wall biosynthesis
MLESMACGCPVLASEIDSCPEIGADAARYFDPRDPLELAELIRTVTRDEACRADLRRRGLERVKCFDWSKTAEATLAGLRAAVEDRNRRTGHAHVEST